MPKVQHDVKPGPYFSPKEAGHKVQLAILDALEHACGFTDFSYNQVETIRRLVYGFDVDHALEMSPESEAFRFRLDL